MTNREAIEILKYANVDYQTMQAIDFAIGVLEEMAIAEKVPVSVNGKMKEVSANEIIFDRHSQKHE